mmetsp:Transcript_23268/g.65200  ORF Transcript_23268/g.65200 Transcript_23268/m.65200 type:complete len:272 (+) Transcript_23268:1684-2499(+)
MSKRAHSPTYPRLKGSQKATYTKKMAVVRSQPILKGDWGSIVQAFGSPSPVSSAWTFLDSFSFRACVASTVLNRSKRLSSDVRMLGFSPGESIPSLPGSDLASSLCGVASWGDRSDLRDLLDAVDSTDCFELPRDNSVRLSSRDTSDSLPCRPKVLLLSLLWGCVSDLFANACKRRAHSRATRGSTPPAEVWPRASSASTCKRNPANMDRGASPPNVISCCIVRQPLGGRASVLTVGPTPARAGPRGRLPRELGAVLRVDRRVRRRRGRRR